MSDSEEEIRRLLGAAKLDQGEAGAASLGRLAGALFTSMVASGVPTRLVATLVRDWFYLQMHRATYPNIAPNVPLWDISMPDEGEEE